MIIEVKNDTMLEASIEKACLVKLQKENQELKNQQKEFIEYLNNMIIAYKRAEKEYGNVADRAFWIAFESALSKYKEIIVEYE